jgi:chemotaxis signal transduction protein
VSTTRDDPWTLDPDHATAATPTGAHTQLFAFRMGERAYALPASCIDAVAPAPVVTPVPTVPAHVAGIVHLRGRILAVVDLAAVLGLEPVRDDAARLIVVGGSQPWAFVAVTTGVRDVADDAIVRDVEQGLLFRGRVDDGDQVLSVLDGDALLAHLLDPHGVRP